MRRLFWRVVSPLVRLANKAGWLSYKWCNVCIASWDRNSFDQLWQYEWFGDEIPIIPLNVNICGMGYAVSYHEGLVKFSRRDGWTFITFMRDPHDVHAHLWYIDLRGNVPASHVDVAYNWVRAVHGGSFEKKDGGAK